MVCLTFVEGIVGAACRLIVERRVGDSGVGAHAPAVWINQLRFVDKRAQQHSHNDHDECGRHTANDGGLLGALAVTRLNNHHAAAFAVVFVLFANVTVANAAHASVVTTTKIFATRTSVGQNASGTVRTRNDVTSARRRVAHVGVALRLFVGELWALLLEEADAARANAVGFASVGAVATALVAVWHWYGNALADERRALILVALLWRLVGAVVEHALADNGAAGFGADIVGGAQIAVVARLAWLWTRFARARFRIARKAFAAGRILGCRDAHHCARIVAVNRARHTSACLTPVLAQIPRRWRRARWAARRTVHQLTFVAIARRRIAIVKSANIWRGWTSWLAFADRFLRHDRRHNVAFVVFGAVVVVVTRNRFVLTFLTTWVAWAFVTLLGTAGFAATCAANVGATATALARIGWIDFKFEALRALCFGWIALTLALSSVFHFLLCWTALRQTFAFTLFQRVWHAAVWTSHLRTITFARSFIDQCTCSAKIVVALARALLRVPAAFWRGARQAGRAGSWTVAVACARLGWRAIARTNWALARAVFGQLLRQVARFALAIAGARFLAVLHDQRRLAARTALCRTRGNDTSKQKRVVFALLIRNEGLGWERS